MSKNDKRKKCAVPVKSGPVVSSPVKLPDVSSELFKLYVARVGQMDIMHSMRTDKRGMFSHALDEARIAYDVYAEQSRMKIPSGDFIGCRSNGSAYHRTNFNNA